MEHGVNANSGTMLGATSDSSYISALPPENTSRQHSRVRHALSQLCCACGWRLAIARVVPKVQERYDNTRLHASSAVYMRSSLFWHVTQL
jgi:hypothetical protein